MMDGDLDATELPARWNNSMKELLGVDPPNDAEGVLQDVHWSAILVGYFPSYLLGAVMAAQLWHYALLDPVLNDAPGGLEGRLTRECANSMPPRDIPCPLYCHWSVCLTINFHRRGV
jgi:hypothetical protein